MRLCNAVSHNTKSLPHTHIDCPLLNLQEHIVRLKRISLAGIKRLEIVAKRQTLVIMLDVYHEFDICKQFYSP